VAPRLVDMIMPDYDAQRSVFDYATGELRAL
jgi:hypothetical protein